METSTIPGGTRPAAPVEVLKAKMLLVGTSGSKAFSDVALNACKVLILKRSW
jgi:hypothetical protein